MPTIAIEPLFLIEVDLTFGPTATSSGFEKHVTGCQFVPSTSKVAIAGLGGNTHQRATLATWVLNLDLIQDWKTTGSLSRYLMENEGKSVEVTLRPADGASLFTTTVTIEPGQIGGAGGGFGTGTVSLACSRPVVGAVGSIGAEAKTS